MKRLVSVLICFAMAGTVLAAGPPTPEASSEAQATYADVQKTLGLVPGFVRMFPPAAVPGAWEEMKSLQMSPTAIPGKYKELIGLGVAAQIPCEYCIYFHTAAARLQGASDQEISEAIAMAAITRHWSTVLNGTLIDESEFRNEAKQIFDYVSKPAKNAATPIVVTDAASAYKDIEATFGIVPTFMKSFPNSGIAGAWRELKALQLNPNTAIPGQYKELIGLAVAAQVPCRYCTYFHTEAAKLNGASAEQVKEAVGMAALTRHWSTVLNGNHVDFAQFKKEADAIIDLSRKQMNASK